MAKKDNRSLIGLECLVCKSRNYVTSKNSVNTKDKVKLNKYCKKCRKHTSHEEVKKLD